MNLNHLLPDIHFIRVLLIGYPVISSFCFLYVMFTKLYDVIGIIRFTGVSVNWSVCLAQLQRAVEPDSPHCRLSYVEVFHWFLKLGTSMLFLSYGFGCTKWPCLVAMEFVSIVTTLFSYSLHHEFGRNETWLHGAGNRNIHNLSGGPRDWVWVTSGYGVSHRILHELLPHPFWIGYWSLGMDPTWDLGWRVRYHLHEVGWMKGQG